MEDNQNKIISVEELSTILTSLKESGNVVVQVHGVFDVIHPGIVRHIESAKKQGDILVTTVIKDSDVRKGPGYPIFKEDLRAENAASVGDVDYVTIVEDIPSLKSVQLIKPDVFARGQDYEERDINIMKRLEEEEDAIKVAGCKVHYTNGVVFSSTSIINNFLDVYPEETREFLNQFKKKHSAASIIKHIDDLRDLKVLVIGDTIIDEYHYTEALGKSLKDNLVVNRYLTNEVFAGGAVAVANHVAGLCKDVELVTVLGKNDSKEDFIESKLRDNIKPSFFYREDGPTIVKRRFVDQYSNQKMYEICFMKNADISASLEEDISVYLNKKMSEYDLVLVTDFGHGMITKKLLDIIEEKAKVLAVNVQTNGANAGYNMVTKYKDVDFVCLDTPEARLASQDRYGPIEPIVKELAKKLSANILIVTLGKQGSVGVETGDKINHTPAFASKVVDRIGAGDAFFAFTAPCFAKGYSPELISFIGNTVGALAVQVVCNREPVDPSKLCEFITSILR